jgi:hypothetical protein
VRDIRRERLVKYKAIPSEETTCCTPAYATRQRAPCPKEHAPSSSAGHPPDDIDGRNSAPERVEHAEGFVSRGRGREILMKRLLIAVILSCVVLATVATVAAAGKPPGGKVTTAKFPAGSRIAVAYAAPDMYRFSWPAARGTFRCYRFTVLKPGVAPKVTTDTAGTAVYVKTLNDGAQGCFWCPRGTYRVQVDVIGTAGLSVDQLSIGSFTLK